MPYLADASDFVFWSNFNKVAGFDESSTGKEIIVWAFPNINTPFICIHIDHRNFQWIYWFANFGEKVGKQSAFGLNFYFWNLYLGHA